MVTLEPNKTHRLRFVNPSVEHNYQVSIVDHDMTVIQTDFIPVEPLTTDNIFLGTGQRVDVVINATEAVGSYWMNVTLYGENLCGQSENKFPAAIIRYEGADDDRLPTKDGSLPANSGCRDRLDYSPVLERDVPLDEFEPANDNTMAVTLEVSETQVVWKVNGSAINVDWNRPVLEYVLEGNTSYPASNNLVHIDGGDVWTFWVIENTSPVPHPMHLHGHDMIVLGASEDNAGSFTPADKASLRSRNPARRDTTMLPPAGWLAVAFRADNPGIWLMHCHIAWHVSGGLSLDFMERVSDQAALVSDDQAAEFAENCAAWNQFWADSTLEKPDSGLRRPPSSIPPPVSGVKARQLAF